MNQPTFESPAQTAIFVTTAGGVKRPLGTLEVWTFETVATAIESKTKGVRATFTTHAPEENTAICDILEEYLSAWHLNWYQVAIDDNDPVRDQNCLLTTVPYVDPPPGGWSDIFNKDQITGPCTIEDDNLADNAPWYHDEINRPGESGNPQDPPPVHAAESIHRWWEWMGRWEAALPGQPKFKALGPSSIHFSFEDEPVLQPGMRCHFRNWLVAVGPYEQRGQSCALVQFLTGFEWSAEYESGAEDLSKWRVQFHGFLTDPPDQSLYADLISGENTKAWDFNVSFDPV